MISHTQCNNTTSKKNRFALFYINFCNFLWSFQWWSQNFPQWISKGRILRCIVFKFPQICNIDESTQCNNTTSQNNHIQMKNKSFKLSVIIFSVILSRILDNYESYFRYWEVFDDYCIHWCNEKMYTKLDQSQCFVFFFRHYKRIHEEISNQIKKVNMVTCIE